MARRLVAAGFPMTVYDRDHAKAAELSALAVKVAPDPRGLAGDVDVILSSLPDDPVVESVYLGSDNLTETRALVDYCHQNGGFPNGFVKD
jgi:2-hydroxy-3-oxopropionate reductase